MKNPEMTWRVRRIGRTLWSSIRAHSWLAIEHARRAAMNGPTPDRRDRLPRWMALDEPDVTSDAFHSLDTLRLDRAACAKRKPG